MTADTGATRILVVEDESAISEPLVAALAREGFDATVARTGREALSLAERLEPHLVLLDLMLPDADGRDVCRDLRRRSDVAIIMLTARGTETDRSYHRERVHRLRRQTHGDMTHPSMRRYRRQLSRHGANARGSGKPEPSRFRGS